MRIDWETVGRCVHRTLNDIEPERSRRLDNLINIGIDETSYKKGHKYNSEANEIIILRQCIVQVFTLSSCVLIFQLCDVFLQKNEECQLTSSKRWQLLYVFFPKVV